MNSANIKHDAGGKSRPSWPIDSEVSAVFSDCQKYRYQLREIWDESKPLVMWLLMNPSVACIDYSDPTLIRTGKFARSWGYGGQLVANVHAYRATDKVYLEKAVRILGRNNEELDTSLFQYLSPLGWEHINLTGDYIWRKSDKIGDSKIKASRGILNP